MNLVSRTATLLKITYLLTYLWCVFESSVHVIVIILKLRHQKLLRYLWHLFCVISHRTVQIIMSKQVHIILWVVCYKIMNLTQLQMSYDYVTNISYYYY